MKAMVPRAFPERAFSVRYAMKDLSYALAMADAAGVAVPGRGWRWNGCAPRSMRATGRRIIRW